MPTETTTAIYRFTRDEHSPMGFLSSQRPSTDAMTAICRWEVAARGRRSYVVLDDQDDFLVAKLTLLKVDIDEAASDFNALCVQLGLKYEVVPS
ncbi:hypothetical protein [Variovorax guangxiensis]|uniref:Uncharacterized protein n=1 Tax=Variovorax guangxiensis TaxID=1775474 RepID=A0A502DKX0_9BURK|nr:hypothetical protein [Variovorax guangxiensis]TPG21382.1 hypothetical protein EAH83_17550 [Variovorax ginsengisoli]TPG25432.1 hypothetical protein EAH82_18035 [Variovorax guangxiensis]